MNQKTLLAVCLILGLLRTSKAQYHSTSSTNTFNDFTYFDFSAKANFGIALPVINQQTNYGVNYGIGINANYYFHPIFAVHSGIEIDHTWAGKNITENGLIDNGANLTLQEFVYRYRYNMLNLRFPLGLIFNTTNLNKGFIYGLGFYTKVGIDGHFDITKNNQEHIHFPAYQYNLEKNEYSNKFKRLNLQLYVNIAYQLDKKMSLGGEISSDLFDFLNNQVFAGFSNNIGVYFLYNLASNKR